MAKPIFILGSDYAFDAKQEHIFQYVWDSINTQSVGNRLVIKDNYTDEVIYDYEDTTLLLKHTLPSNILTNGALYNATIQVIDLYGNYSDMSDPILFYCYSTPTFSTTLQPYDEVYGSSCDVGIIYSQPEGEELQSFKIELFNEHSELIYTSGLKYDTSSVVTLSLDYNCSYYIKASGETINHMKVETDMIPFYSYYVRPTLYTYVSAENRYDVGDIAFSSNLVSIEGRGYDGEPTFVDDEYVDTVNGTSIMFDEGFNIEKDFQLILTGYGLRLNEDILILKTKNGNAVYLKWKIDEDENRYIQLTAQSKYLTNIFFSNHIYCEEDTMVEIKITCNSSSFYIRLNEIYDDEDPIEPPRLEG